MPSNNKEYSKEWRENHPDYMENWEKINQIRRKEYGKAYREKHRGEKKEYMKKYAQKYYSNPKNVARHNQNNKKYRIKLKVYFCDLLGNRCEECGRSLIPDENLCAFEFHHIDPKTKEIEAEFREHPHKFYQSISEGKIALLCSYCHRIVTWKENRKT
jgi:hypothetical protein